MPELEETNFQVNQSAEDCFCPPHYSLTFWVFCRILKQFCLQIVKIINVDQYLDDQAVKTRTNVLLDGHPHTYIHRPKMFKIEHAGRRTCSSRQSSLGEKHSFFLFVLTSMILCSHLLLNAFTSVGFSLKKELKNKSCPIKCIILL